MKSVLRLGLFLTALIARVRFNKSSWIKRHCNHCLTMKVTSPNTLLLGDSIIAELARYHIAWKKYFVLLNTANLGIGGDRVQNAHWQTISLPLPTSVQNVLVQCGTNNIFTDSTRDITSDIVNAGTIFWRKSNTVNIIICGLISQKECWSVNRLLTSKVNDILKHECHKNGRNFQTYQINSANVNCTK